MVKSSSPASITLAGDDRAGEPGCPGHGSAVRTGETIDSRKAVRGQTFAAELSRDVRDPAGDVVISRGSNAIIIIRSASKGGRFTGASDLALDLQSVSVDGMQYLLDTTDIEERGRQGLGKNKRHGRVRRRGGDRRGIGRRGGVAPDLLTRGKAVRVPAETVLAFRLDKPLRIYLAR